MVLGAAVEAKLQEAASVIPGQLLRELFEIAARELCRSYDKQPSQLPTACLTTKEQAIESKNAFAAISIFLSDLVRNNATNESTRRTLMDLGFSDNIVDDLICIIESAIQKARPLSEVSGLELDSIVDISWRLDHCIQSNTFGSLCEPLYFITLTTRSTKTGMLVPNQFTCTPTLLQDLVYKLQEAKTQIGKVMDAFSTDS